MKRGTKVHLVGLNGAVIGPMSWTVARNWIGMGFLDPRAPVLVNGKEPWTTLGELDGLLERVAGAQAAGDRLNDPSRKKFAAPEKYHEWAASLGCPFWTQHIDWEFLLERVLAILAEIASSLGNPCVSEIRKEIEYYRDYTKRPGYADWHDEPATEAQVACIQRMGVGFEPEITKGRAHQLISGEPTEGQLRRLSFYRIELPKFATKDEVAFLIDEYKHNHQESEEAYQRWKGERCATGATPRAHRPALAELPLSDSEWSRLNPRTWEVSTAGKSLGRFSLKDIRRKINCGALDLDEDLYFDDQAQQWLPLLVLIES